MAVKITSMQCLFLTLSCYVCFHEAYTFDQYLGLSSMSYNVYNTISCGWRECCTDEYISLNVTGLRNDLRSKLHGQHLVTDSVIRLLQGHFSPSSNPKKALVLSFHGPTGSGKNFVANMIAKHTFRYGMQSQYIRFLIATHHFAHSNFTETYKAELRAWIKKDVSACARSMFIIDEMDKMPIEVMNVITPFIDHYENIDFVDYRKAVFIFLSNTGSKAIAQYSHEQLHTRAVKREDLLLNNFEHLVKQGAFDENDSLGRSNIVQKHLVSAFIPFLPMERRHVKLCVRDDLQRKNITMSDENVIDRIADTLEYYPDDTRLFSSSGCKRVSQKVDLIVERI